MNLLIQRLDQHIPKKFHASCQHLHDHIVPVAIHHQTRQAITFTKHPAIGIGLGIELFAQYASFM